MTVLALGPGVSPGFQQLTGNGVLDTTAMTFATLGGNNGITFPNIPGLTLVFCKTVTGDPVATVTPGAQILGVSIPPTWSRSTSVLRRTCPVSLLFSPAAFTRRCEAA
jgi:hypothetical protein